MLPYYFKIWFLFLILNSFWIPSENKDKEICLNPQSDDSCEFIEIPDCVDRRVYCEEIPDVKMATKSYLGGSYLRNSSHEGSMYEITCDRNHHFFNYSKDDYINEIIFTCTNYG